MFCISLFLLFFFNATLSIKICSFNVRSFGEAKRARPEVLDVIVKVISRCDIMLLMEIKDNSNKICPLLIEKLNGQYQEEYDYVISTRLGRKSYKEQYAFIYRSNVVSVKGTYQYPDIQPGDVDAFSREPFVVWFKSPKTVVKEFVIIPQHTTPETAVREIDELYDVYLDVKQRWKSKNFIFMGDFNAGCSYVPKKHWKNIRLKTHSEFVWLIGDKNDTTVRNSTNCAYDRIVIHGEKLINAVVPNSADIIDFQRAFGMTEEQALEVSDHFPVVFELKTTRGFLNGPRSRAAKERKTRTLHHLSS
ncbi:deoxyribonuclease gamma [Malaclemys terrapin pileata]|uniref:deoxyribonuclease gamma n=1 Tax=Malaclemys terrapin pileata TaxID=2991368 RepID=UPI0023A803C1|nr:deoxyribonuclease gamma [Malaclemys terrapin pileata]